MTPEELTFEKLKEPAPEINSIGTKRWYNENGKLHRENDLPAVIFNNGEQWWYKNGVLHRENGPAIVFSDGSEAHWYTLNDT